MTAPVARVVALYDADCGFCTRLARRLPTLGLSADVRALQTVDLAAFGIDPQRALVEMPVVGVDGVVQYGHRAWAGLLATGPRPVRALGRLLVAPVTERVAAWVYRWVSAHRAQLPGGTPSCAMAPSSLRPPSG